MKATCRHSDEDGKVTVVPVKLHEVEAGPCVGCSWFQERSKPVFVSLCTGSSEQLPVRSRGPPERALPVFRINIS
jgi:hypothetical protein